MDEITVSVEKLYERAKQMLDDGMDVVTIGISDAEGEGEDAIPPFMWFEASTKDAPYEGIDYEDIDAVAK